MRLPIAAIVQTVDRDPAPEQKGLERDDMLPVTSVFLLLQLERVRAPPPNYRVPRGARYERGNLMKTPCPAMMAGQGAARLRRERSLRSRSSFASAGQGHLGRAGRIANCAYLKRRALR